MMTDKQLAVFSTMTADVDYTFWDTSRVNIGQNQVVERILRINGKANLANKSLITPRGAVTRITDAEHDLLQSNPVFQAHLRNGFVTVEDYRADLNDVVSGMVPRDASAPMEMGDFDEKSPQPLVSQKQAEEQAEQPTSATVKAPSATTAKRRNTSRKTQTKE